VVIVKDAAGDEAVARSVTFAFKVVQYDSAIMSQCDLCGTKAGWLQKRHPECATRASNVEKTLRELILNGAAEGEDFAQLQPEIASACGGIPIEHFRAALIQAADDAATKLSLASPITDEQLTRMVGIIQGLGFEANEAHKEEVIQRQWFGMSNLFMSSILWHVLNGDRPYYDGTGRIAAQYFSWRISNLQHWRDDVRRGANGQHPIAELRRAEYPNRGRRVLPRWALSGAYGRWPTAH
jgi:hypothetical protein